jgi:hypothetical protein
MMRAMTRFQACYCLILPIGRRHRRQGSRIVRIRNLLALPYCRRYISREFPDKAKKQ